MEKRYHSSFSKSEIAKNIQRAEIINSSIFGIWSDEEDSIEFKITPLEHHVRIKIMEVKNKAILERISFFCGLLLPPKRNQWRGFEFITNLTKESAYSFIDGIVHFPNANRKNSARISVLDNSKILINFYFNSVKEKVQTENFIGSFKLIKKLEQTKQPLD